MVTYFKVLGLFAVSYAKMAQPIDLPFELWTLVGEGSTSSLVFARWRQLMPPGKYD